MGWKSLKAPIPREPTVLMISSLCKEICWNIDKKSNYFLAQILPIVLFTNTNERKHLRFHESRLLLVFILLVVFPSSKLFFNNWIVVNFHVHIVEGEDASHQVLIVRIFQPTSDHHGWRSDPQHEGTVISLIFFSTNSFWAQAAYSQRRRNYQILDLNP